MYPRRFTDDPLADWDAHCADEEAEMDRAVYCDECDEPITDDYCYKVGAWLLCKNCLLEKFEIPTPWWPEEE